MTWARGQYRQAKHGGVYLRSVTPIRTLPSMAIASVFLVAILGLLAVLISDEITIAGTHEPILVAVLISLCTALMVWTIYAVQIGASRQRLIQAAYARCALDTPTNEQFVRLTELRHASEPLPELLLDELERAYGQLVQVIVADGIAEAHELERLTRTEAALLLPARRVQSARLQGFLDVYDRAIEDGILTEEEQASIDHIREALDVPERQVRQELAFTKQLAYAREVKHEQLVPVQVGMRLHASEQAYYATMGTQRKRVLRSYDRNGARQREYVFEPMQAGNLIITNERVAFEAGAVKSIRLSRIMEVGVDAEFKYLTIHEHRHKNLHYFDIPQPYMAVAYLERLLEHPSVSPDDS